MSQQIKAYQTIHLPAWFIVFVPLRLYRCAREQEISFFWVLCTIPNGRCAAKNALNLMTAQVEGFFLHSENLLLGNLTFWVLKIQFYHEKRLYPTHPLSNGLRRNAAGFPKWVGAALQRA